MALQTGELYPQVCFKSENKIFTMLLIARVISLFLRFTIRLTFHNLLITIYFSDIGATGARRRTLQRQNREASGGRGPLQTSASLPETPVFARGCDVPRTPPRNSTGPPRNNTMNSIQSIGNVDSLKRLSGRSGYLLSVYLNGMVLKL